MSPTAATDVDVVAAPMLVAVASTAAKQRSLRTYTAETQNLIAPNRSTCDTFYTYIKKYQDDDDGHDVLTMPIARFSEI